MSRLSYYPLLILIAVLVPALSVPHAAALYDFEGIPLAVHAQGATAGDILTYGKYGLANPPYDLSFSLPAAPRYARVYTGIWGGTEKYTGWAELNVNNLRKVRYSLNGERDRNSEVYVSGHGIYWIGYDTTGLLKQGNNMVSVSTSKNDPGNKLDGRVYCVFVVAVVDTSAGGTTRYWIAEGNENLHGEGWAGTNPTRHDKTNVTFPGSGTSDLTGANLTVLLLAGGKGQPDYVQFNNHYLGVPVRTVKGFNVTDIGNEISSDAEGGPGIESRYVDAETFSVGNFVEPENTVIFLRGIDLDGDGTITTTGDAPEGEDYIHPVIAILAERTAGSPVTDLAMEKIVVNNAYSGETATVTAEVRSYGIQPKEAVPVTFFVNGNAVNTTKASLNPSGITRVSVPWAAVTGTYTLSAEVSAPGDTVVANNRAEHQATIGTPPDLAVSVSAPVKKGDAAGSGPAKSPVSLVPAIAGLAVIAFMGGRLARAPALPAILLALAVIATAGLAVPAGAADLTVQEYSLPVIVANNGGSDSPAFTVSVYLDGEKIADRQVDGGVKAHSTAMLAIPVFTTPGSHDVKVVADEAGLTRDTSRPNNAVQGKYEFPK